MLNKSVTALAFATTVVVLALTGCTTPKPAAVEPTPSASSPIPAAPTPTPTVDPVASAIVLEATRFSIESDSAVVLDSFDLFEEGEGARAVAALAEVLGEPTIAPLDTSVWKRKGAQHTWGKFEVDVYEDVAAFPTVSEMFIRTGAAEVDGIRIESRSGITIGDALSNESKTVYFADDGAWLHAIDTEDVDLTGTGASVFLEYTGQPARLVATAIAQEERVITLWTPEANFKVSD